MLTEEDRRRIRDAVRAAEGRTSGEIHCVVAAESDRYFYPASFVLAVVLAGLSLPAAMALERLWLTLPLSGFAAAQALALALGLGLLRAWRGLRIRLVPRGLRFRRAHENAVKQFLAHNIHRTEARTGVLIFVSLAERYAEVVADAGIDARVPQEAWNEAVERLTARAAEGRVADGFVEAVEAVGRLLAEHFPPADGDRNELPDHVVEI